MQGDDGDGDDADADADADSEGDVDEDEVGVILDYRSSYVMSYLFYAGVLLRGWRRTSRTRIQIWSF